MAHRERERERERVRASDIGGVILTDMMIEPDALDGLRALASAGTLYLLSFCGKATENTTREILIEMGVDEIVPVERWIFVRNRKHKAREMRRLGISVLIDDRDDTIDHVRSQGLEGYLYTGWKQVIADLCGGDL